MGYKYLIMVFCPIRGDAPITLRSLFHQVLRDLLSSSIMDPLTVFSLVCGIIQIVDTSMEIAKKCRELYKYGASSEDREIENMAKHLTDLYGHLDPRAKDSPGELKDLYSKCSDTAKQLCTEVQTLKINGPHRKREVVFKSIKAMWKRSAIEEIQRQLGGYQRMLDSKILVDLSKSFRLFNLQQSEDFKNVDQKLQTIITKLAQSPQSFEDLSALMRHGDESIKSHITHEFQQDRSERARERYRQRFLESLYYPEIDRRQDTVIEAHQKTFQWVYGPDSFGTSAPGWDSMAEWLEKGDGIYWINGKAGSGKSTLMKYLCQDERTLGLLRVWSGTKKVLNPKYFFWSAGTILEKSIEGLLRSLLYQILREIPSLVPLACEDRSSLVPARDHLDDFEPIGTWTVRRLGNTFQDVLRQAVTTNHLCIFIDGLDEINGDPDAVIAEITKMPSFAIKVCLSSRPERSYNDAFGSCAKLRLQDLTESDIRAYVTDRLEPWLRNEPKVEVSGIMNDIAHKAQGVFLWVDLVLKALIKGLKDDDSLEQLQVRVASTPSDIEAVYANMLSKIDVVHYREAAQLFQMTDFCLSQSLLDVALALYNHSDSVSETSVSDALRLCERTQNRIPTVCGGLLDVDLEDRGTSVGGGFFGFDQQYLCLPIKYTCSPERADLSFFERYVHLSFIYRTAADFMKQSKQGQSLIGACPQTHPSPFANLIMARLTKVTLLGFPEKPSKPDDRVEELIHDAKKGEFLDDELPIESPWDHIRDRIARDFIHGLMYLLCQDEWLTGSASMSLYHDVDRTLTAVYRRKKGVPFAHWSMQWGLRTGQTWHEKDWSGWCEERSQSKYLDPNSVMSESNPLSEGRPVDLLGLAASWSLSCYVIEELDKQKIIETDYATYLLCCTMWGAINANYQNRTEPTSKLLDLVTDLLNRGANPNFYAAQFPDTLWGLFIRSPLWSNHNVRAKRVLTAKTFVEKGADIHMTLLSEKTFAWKSPKSQAPSDDESISINLSREMSISHYFRAQSKLVETAQLELVEILLANGARDHSKYYNISVQPQTIKMSKKQHDKWLGLLNAGNVNDDNCVESEGKQWRFAGHVRKYYKENLGEDEDSDIQMTWEDGDDHQIDFESRSHFCEVVAPLRPKMSSGHETSRQPVNTNSIRPLRETCRNDSPLMNVALAGRSAVWTSGKGMPGKGMPELVWLES
ncbi:hypothetical protein BDR22DRAFT_862620 [Usnea florida]